MAKKFKYVDNTTGLDYESETFESSDFKATGGAGSENLPPLLNGSGLLDASLLDVSGIDHGGLGGLGDDDHTQYTRADGTRAFTANQSMGGFELTNLAAPTAANSAVTKAYADSLRTENGMKGNVDIATTANITLSGEQTIDGTLTSASRVLVKDQTDPKENGIYVSAAGAWVRSEDMDNSPTSEIMNGVIIPRVQNSASGQDAKSFYISSVGTGTGGVHTVGVDNIVIEVYTTSTQLTAGSGVDIALNVVNIDLADVDPGLYFDGNSDIGIDWSTAFNDAKAIKASDINSAVNGKGASIVGIEDAGGFTLETDVEGSLQELYGLISANGVEYTVGVGGVTKGDVCYIDSANTVKPYATLSAAHRGIGIALTTEAASGSVKVLANDTIITGVLTGATPGDAFYWNGTTLQNSIPSGGGSHVWQGGVAKNATDLHVEVRFVKKN